MINRVVLVGRLTRDPELRKTANGASVASFTIAIDNFAKGPNGEKTTSFIPCVAWNQQADNVVKYVRKGSLVGVEGRLNQRVYFDSKDGRKIQVIEVICDSVQFLESKGSSNATKEESETLGFEQEEVQKEVEEEKNVASIDIADDDLPF